MKTRIRKLLMANGVSMAFQVAVLLLLSACGLNPWLAIGISKGASWSVFALHLMLTR